PVVRPVLGDSGRWLIGRPKASTRNDSDHEDARPRRPWVRGHQRDGIERRDQWSRARRLLRDDDGVAPGSTRALATAHAINPCPLFRNDPSANLRSAVLMAAASFQLSELPGYCRPSWLRRFSLLCVYGMPGRPNPGTPVTTRKVNACAMAA